MIKHYICDVLSGNMAKSGLILIWKALVACKIRHICNLVGQDINVFVWLPLETAPKCIISPTFLTPHQPGHPLPLPPLEVHTLIIFQNDTKDCIKSIEPQSGVRIGTLFFGHSGDHYVVIKPWKKVKKMASVFLSILQIVV